MRKLILASKSPRRIEILGRYSIEFSIEEAQIEENNNIYKNPKQLAMSLAFEKAYNVATRYPESIVLAADTVVALGDLALNKPRDREDALGMLTSLSGKTHKVITGYSIISLNEKIKIVNYESSKVSFKVLDEDTITRYLNRGEYEDKAGSYAIQGFGALLVDKIIGDYDNIVGLPISSISDLLKETFDIHLF